MATLVIGTWGLRFSRTTSDFFVASRSVRPGLNASAISGEYLSGASFLGIAGLVLSFGAEMLWYPVGWTAGYLVLLVLVAAPLRRSGAYTLPDFAEARLDSRTVRTRRIGDGGGDRLALRDAAAAGRRCRACASATGLPAWTGGLLVAVVVLLNVLAGGMRSITFVQAFQYWLKLFALLAASRRSSSSCGWATADVRRRTRACSSAASPARPGRTRSTSRATTRSTRRTP